MIKNDSYKNSSIKKDEIIIMVKALHLEMK